MADQLTTGIIFSTLSTAVAWLAKKLYDAPRPSEFDQVVKERNELRQIIDVATKEAKDISAKRDVEYQKLQTEVVSLRARVYGTESGGALHAPFPLDKEKARVPHGRRTVRSRPPPRNG